MTKAKNTKVRKNQYKNRECPGTWLCFEIITKDYSEMSNHTHRANTETNFHGQLKIPIFSVFGRADIFMRSMTFCNF